MSLKIIMGNMFSGKTSELIRRLKRYKVIGKRILSEPKCVSDTAIWKHASSFTSASGNLPVELLHSISTDATTNGAVS